jgi:type I restriction-modification system DNA methylase subunit
LVDDLVFTDHPGSLAAFSQRPFDSRSACILAWDEPDNALLNARLAHARQSGAPVVFICSGNELHWWKQGSTSQPSEYLRVPAHQVEGFFREHHDDLAPQTIYRAKTLGRFDVTHQREFVDVGLMPAVEREMGEVIQRLVLDQVAALREQLRMPKNITLEQGQWLVKSVFWLLGAKMLHDKAVEGFIRLNFDDVDQVFDRVARHYGQSAEAIITSERRRQALQTACSAIASRADLSLATTESLGYVYENTLITKEVGRELGTHSTPAYLIDYIVGRLEPWISAVPEDERRVFEPACGHSGFLVASVRLLTSLLRGERAAPSHRRAYLRKMVQGCDKDEFAIEIARLSLTLTDIPNPNGWNLQLKDAFASDVLESAASKSRILLANPPFEAFKPDDKRRYTRAFREPTFVSKTAEMLHRSVAALPADGVFGLVVPQTLLHSKDGAAFRKLLTDSTEFDEICLFPDKVFNFADVETAVVIGRKTLARADGAKAVRYRRVREGEIDSFKSGYRATSELDVTQSRFQTSDTSDLRVPDLEEIWASIAHYPKLGDLAEIGQGFSFIGEDQKNYPKGQKRTSPVPRRGFEEGFENLGTDVPSHKLPSIAYLNVSPDIVRVAMAGTTVGRPQILLNEAPRQRGAWCVNAMIDTQGRVATSSFTIFRSSLPLVVKWALTNNPLANAYAYAHSSKWHILTGTWRQLPVPRIDAEASRRIETAANTYLASVHAFENDFSLRNDEDRDAEREALRVLHWRMDAEVLKLYALPVELERRLLDYFAGCKRVGVPFHQDRYFPPHFHEALSLADFLAITADWEATNTRRLELIEFKLQGQLGAEGRTELERLKKLAWAKAQLVRPLPLEEAKATESELKRKGLWVGP